ncbi:MAG TPA: endonuclease/exonuclease/phosphatase family protein [Candidatus Latescibacteria bacterium]|nr:endonuclease/exonuclease/phosphatase family protein [Candidatus Latescibacterota bacterium]
MRIVVHNVYWFQGCPSRWGAERVAAAPAVFDGLVELYASLSPDVICLQEVQNPDLVATAAKKLGMASWIHARGGVKTDYGGAILTRNPSEMRDLTSNGSEPPHERVHVRAQVTNGKDILEIACVHLPSNRFAGSPEEGSRARVAEVEQVLRCSPVPDIVVGDMNFRKGSEPYLLMKSSGYVNAGETDVAEDSPERKGDHIWLLPAAVRRLERFFVVTGEPFVQTDADGTVWRLSDHHPLVADLR